MRKAVLSSLVLLILLIPGCSRNDEVNSVYEIGENMFITQIDDINLNYREYLGRTIKLEGLFMQNHWAGVDSYYVIRNAPGCCGDDGEVGFQVSWETPYEEDAGDDKRTYPKTSDWVEAQGELKSYERSGIIFVYIALSELNVLEKRGAEFVNR